VWNEACKDVALCDTLVKDVHYRVVTASASAPPPVSFRRSLGGASAESEGGAPGGGTPAQAPLGRVIMLDAEGNVPKVPMTAAWLQYLNYKLCGVRPVAESRFACVCTPYVFKKYAGIFGLSGSVGGKAELEYLTSTYSAVKFEVRAP